MKKKSKSNASSKLSQNDASPVWPFSSSSNLLKNDNNNNNSQNISNSEENSLVTSSPLESLGSSTNSRTKSLKLSGTKEKNNTNRKSNRKFHQLFPSVSINETVIDTYSCAYVKSLNLLHGVMFLTNNYICFYSKILSAENILIIKLQHVSSIKKTMHALIFPTAIRIQTQNSVYSFTSFRSRSNTLDHLITLLGNYQKRLENSSIRNRDSELSDNSSKTNDSNDNVKSMTQTESWSEEEDLNDSYEKEHDLTSELLSITDEENNLDVNNNNMLMKSTPVTTYFNNFVAYDQHKKHNRSFKELNNKNSVPFISNSCYRYYDIDYSDLSNRKVTVSLRNKKSLIQKVKILISLLIPAFFDISRIDSLLPICFLMCVLLLLNAFVLLNKVSKVDELFADLLIHTDAVI